MNRFLGNFIFYVIKNIDTIKVSPVTTLVELIDKTMHAKTKFIGKVQNIDNECRYQVEVSIEGIVYSQGEGKTMEKAKYNAAVNGISKITSNKTMSVLSKE